MSFDCSRCGACCRMAGAILELRSFDRGDGTCRHLTADNLCSIYEERPRVCRVDEMQPAVMQTAEWYRRNAAACAKLHLHVYGQPIAR